ncbi:Crp/Fnr family transcriptional regulator [Sphaerotilus sp.]|uniref:Crp/Fnr family transcriptional regulator n=1 Tax=Sphaerotilus sp. TaxID=2093942 RepID=UPI0034E28332
MLSPDLSCLIDQSTWGRALTSAERAQVMATTTERRIGAGEAIVSVGDAASHWLGMIDGLAKMSVTAADGRITTLTGASRGAWFGEGSLLRREPFRYDIIALRDSRIAELPRATFEVLRQGSLSFNHCLQHLMNARLGLFIGMLRNDRLLAPDARVAACLASLYNPDLAFDPGPRLDLTQAEIALLAGVSRQRTNQALQRLHERGLVCLCSRGLQIPDVEGLQAYASEPIDRIKILTA